MLAALSGALFGLTSGVRHAIEPDHLAAVSTFVAEQRTPRQSVSFAVAWGAGHALMLVVVGGALMLLGRSMPPAIEDAFELLVAVVLIALGARSLAAALRGRAQAVAHGHAPSRPTLSRPLVVGLLHGLSGSGALTAMVVARLASPLAGLGFMVLYGAGATLGMAAIAGLAGVPLAKITRARHGFTALLAVTGVGSLVVGVAWGAPLALKMF